MTDKIRVVLVDDHDVVREGLRGYLRVNEDIEVVGDASDGQEAIEVCRTLKPDVVLMDLRMPGMDGVEATRQIRALDLAIQVVILTSFDDDDSIQNALQAGAIGYLLKNSNVHQVIAGIWAAYQGRSILSPEATQALIQSKTRIAKPNYNLKGRELEVLALLVDGMTNDQIAARLNLSRSTIKFHVSGILAKLGVESRTEAVALAMRENLLH
ncbi:MAG: response regulator transcription factor [Chitinophagaceae bacterium]|nr:response regulator transcription factor [Anaerolineae bacterium]